MSEESEWKRPGCGRSLDNLGVKCGDMMMPNPYRIEAPEYHLCKRCSQNTRTTEKNK